VFPRSTIRHLTHKELTNPAQTSACKAFDDDIMQKIVVPATEAEFEKDYLTPTYDYYEDDHEEGAPVAPSDDLVPTPDKEANYLNMEVMLPHSVKLVRG